MGADWRVGASFGGKVVRRGLSLLRARSRRLHSVRCLDPELFTVYCLKSNFWPLLSVVTTAQ